MSDKPENQDGLPRAEGAEWKMDETQTIQPAMLGDHIMDAEFSHLAGKDPESFVGRYKVIRKIGEGNMGRVWLCEDTVGNVQVAIKSLPVRKSGDKELMLLVRDNFRIVQKLNHPNIGNAKSLEYEEESGSYYLVMEYIEGETLEKVLKRYPTGMPLEEIVPIMRAVAAGLDYSHGKTTVHRDIKPSNIVVENETGTPKILDFGIAGEFVTTMLRKQRKSVTDTTSQSGTPYFMAPEQWKGYKQDGRTDQYGLAATVYALLDGRPPFAFATNVEAVMDCALNVPVERLDNVDNDVWEVLEKAFSKEKNDRHASCTEFIDALDATLQPAAAFERAPGMRRRRWLGWAAALVLAAGTGVAAKMLLDGPVGSGGGEGVHGGIGLPGNLHYHALVIGVNDYDNGWPELKNAANDAKVVGRILEDKYGFSVTTLLDEEASQAAIIEELERITDKTVRDMVLIYFAGHGERYRNPDEGYWIPSDAMGKDRVPGAKSSWIWNSVITRYIEGSSARHILVVADACYAGTLFQTSSPDTTINRKYKYQELLDRPSRHVLTSGNYESVYDQDGAVHSPFAQRFIGYLEDNQQPVFSIAELSNSIRPGYEKHTGKTMRLAPLIRETGGQFIFVQRNLSQVGLLEALGAKVHPDTLVSDRVYEGLNLLAARGHTNAMQRISRKLESRSGGDGIDQLARVLARQAEADRRSRAMSQATELIEQIATLREQIQQDPVFAEKRRAYAQPRIFTVLGPRSDLASETQANLGRTVNLGLTAALQASGARVVERDVLNSLLTEIDLDAANLADPRIQAMVGKMLPATLLIDGEITRENDEDRLTLSLVDTATSEDLQMIHVPLGLGDNLGQRLQDLADQIVSIAREKRPLTARVALEGGAFEAFAGRFHGLAKDSVFDIVQRTIKEDALFKEVRDTKIGRAAVSVLGTNQSGITPEWDNPPPPTNLDNVWIVERAP